MTIDRRRFLQTAAATAMFPAVKSLGINTAQNAATVTLHSDQPGPTVPTNFIGLSYETKQLSDPKGSSDIPHW